MVTLNSASDYVSLSDWYWTITLTD